MKPSVLVVDDEAAIRALLRLCLRDAYECLEAAGGEEALALLRVTPVDALLIDLRMPGMDGLQLLSVAKEQAPSRPVVVVTALDEPEVAVEAMKRGADDYLTKPFSRERLARTLEEALGQHASRKGGGEREVSLDRVVGTSTQVPEPLKWDAWPTGVGHIGIPNVTGEGRTSVPRYEREFTWRFGMVAVQSGFITADKFVEAIAVQLSEDLKGRPHRLIGMILLALGYLTADQVEQITQKAFHAPGPAGAEGSIGSVRAGERRA